MASPPAIKGFTLFSEGASRPLTHLRLQIPQQPQSVSIGLKLLREFLKVLPTEVILSVLVRPTVDEEKFRGLLRHWKVDPDRVRLAPSWHVTNLFARDSAQSGTLPSGESAILLPRSVLGMASETEIQGEAEAEEGLGLPVFRSGLFWEGGNLLYDGHHGFIGANTVGENVVRLGLGEDQVLQALEAEFGVSFNVMGDVGEACDTLRATLEGSRPQRIAEAGQADFHLDLDLALLGEIGGTPTAVVADPDMGLAFLPEVLAGEELFRNHFLPPKEMKLIFQDDLRAAIEVRRPRLESYRDTLDELGYRVVGIPDLRLMDEGNHLGRTNTRFNYCNVLSGAIGGRPSVLLFSYGLADLDRAGFDVYRKLGVEPIAVGPDEVTSAELMALGGGIHCFTSRLA